MSFTPDRSYLLVTTSYVKALCEMCLRHHIKIDKTYTWTIYKSSIYIEDISGQHIVQTETMYF